MKQFNRIGIHFALLVTMLTGACSTVLTDQERYAQAVEYTTDRYQDPGYRAAAMGHWVYLDEPANRAALTAEQTVMVDFGIGFLTLVDLLAGADILLDTLGGSSDETTSDETTMELTPDVIVSLVGGLRENLIEASLAARFKAVIDADPDFNLDLSCDVVVHSTCYFDGNLDAGDIGFFAGLFGVVNDLIAHLEHREHLLELVLDIVFNPPELNNKDNLFRQLPSVAYSVLEEYSQKTWQKSFAASPLLTMKDGTSLQADRAAMASSIGYLLDGFVSTRDESDGDQDEEVFDSAHYITDILQKLLGLDTGILAVAETAGILDIGTIASELAAILVSLQAAEGTDGQYYFPSIYEDLESFVERTPQELHLPSLWFGGLFGTAWQDPKTLILPTYDTAAAAFYADHEQEPYAWSDDTLFYTALLADASVRAAGVDGVTGATAPRSVRPGADDGVFNDELGYRPDLNNVLAPLLHYHPETDALQPANQWVDPLYLFWDDASMGGVLRPTMNAGSTSNPDYQADLATSYANQNLNGLVSAILTLATDLLGTL